MRLLEDAGAGDRDGLVNLRGVAAHAYGSDHLSIKPDRNAALQGGIVPSSLPTPHRRHIRYSNPGGLFREMGMQVWLGEAEGALRQLG